METGYSNPYSDVGYNYMGSTKSRDMGNGLWRFLFEPFVTFEEPRNPKTGTLWRGAKKLIISYLLEAFGVYFLTLVVAGIAAGGFKSGLNISLIGLLAGVAHAAMRYAISGWRHTPYLPRNLSPTFTWMRVFHGTYGAVWALIENAVQYGFAALAAATLTGLTLGAGDEWRGIGKFGTAAALSDFSAWILFSLILFFIGFAELFNQTIESKRYSYNERHNHAAGLVSFVIIGLTALSVHFGIYSNNELVAFAGGLAAGNLSSIGTIKWLILLIFSPLFAVALIVFLKWLLWNVNDIDKDRVDQAKREARLDGVEGSDGGVPHEMQQRTEVNNNVNNDNSGSLVQSLISKKRKGKKTK